MKFSNLLPSLIVAASAFLSTFSLRADYPVHYDARIIINAGSGEFAPYYISAIRHGILTQSQSALLRLSANRPLNLDKRFDYSFGIDFLTGTTSCTNYQVTRPEIGPSINPQRPPSIWLQQLYAHLKYRSLFLSAGIKERNSRFVNSLLSTGDVIESGNARPIPQIRVGFTEFQNIPFTNQWLQLQGELAFGKYFNNSYLRTHNNCNSYSIDINSLYHYKHLYFRTKPSKPFSLTFGGQFVCIFGGKKLTYSNGVLTSVVPSRTNIKAYWQALIPLQNGYEGWYEGNHLGSWNIRLRYRFRNNHQLIGYVMNLWEDGSGMGKLNGWDGLWGLEYKAPRKGYLSGALLEIISWTNQGGGLNWDPVEYPGTTLTHAHATGGDSYYNNGYHGSYAYYGLAIGNPFSKQPLYNIDGANTFCNNRVRGFHIALKGEFSPSVAYRLMFSRRTSWGTYATPAIPPRKNTSFLAETTFTPQRIPDLAVKAQFALDHGTLYSNPVGAALTISYSGIFNFKKSSK